jgi:hypothetical protein
MTQDEAAESLLRLAFRGAFEEAKEKGSIIDSSFMENVLEMAALVGLIKSNE